MPNDSNMLGHTCESKLFNMVPNVIRTTLSMKIFVCTHLHMHKFWYVDGIILTLKQEV